MNGVTPVGRGPVALGINGADSDGLWNVKQLERA